MMPLENLPGVLVLQGCRGGARHIEKQIHAHRKIRRINESRPVALHQLSRRSI
jgi:hypothetical protein